MIEPMIETVELPDLLFMGIQVEADRDALERLVPEAWQRLFSAESGATAFLRASEPADNGRLRELVGFLAASSTDLPDGLLRRARPAARYLRLAYQGPLDGIGQGFARLERHAASAGLDLTGVKLDFGYLPGLAASVHELYAEIAPPRLLLA